MTQVEHRPDSVRGDSSEGVVANDTAIQIELAVDLCSVERFVGAVLFQKGLLHRLYLQRLLVSEEMEVSEVAGEVEGPYLRRIHHGVF